MQMMKKGLGGVVLRAGNACAGLGGWDTTDAEEAADFGCLDGGRWD